MEVMYRKYHAKLKGKFACLGSLVTVLENSVFQPIETAESGKVDEPLRRSALELLKQICSESPDCIKSVVAKFYPLIKDAKWRTNILADWEIYVEDRSSEKLSARDKFVGLDNPANSI